MTAINRTYRLDWRVVAALLALILSRAGLAQSTVSTRPTTTTAPAVVEPAPNPHWSSTGCQHCHSKSSGKYERIPAETVDAICLKCHDGIRARAERHPIGRTFDNKQNVLPSGWPAPKDKLGCLTCHDVLAGCDHKAVRSTNNPQFLREYDGVDLLSYCGRCHVTSGSQGRFNPHAMLAPDGAIVEKACRFCHQKSYGAHRPKVRTGDAALRLDAITLCLSCHPRHVEFFEPGHIGARILPEMKARLKANSTTQPAGHQEALLVSAPLPLADGDRIVCSTCHNPHQEGVFPPDSVLSPGAFTGDQHQPRLPLRRPGKEVCLGCHEK
jgi:predicted CXXCH cytochrome family protein